MDFGIDMVEYYMNELTLASTNVIAPSLYVI